MKAEGYFGRAARIVLSNRTWFWRAAVVAAVSLVPYVGTLIALGYYMILMRDAAWGVNRGLPRFAEYREILRRALDGFVVSLVWGLALAVPLLLVVGFWLSSNLSRLSAGSVPLLPWWFVYALWIPSLALSVLTNVAVLRAAVFLKPSAGLSLREVLNLIRRSPSGFRRVTALFVGTSVIALLIRTPITSARYFGQVPSAALTYGWGLVAGAIVAPLMFILYVAYGLWGQETDPASWPPPSSPAAGQPTDGAPHTELPPPPADGEWFDA